MSTIKLGISQFQPCGDVKANLDSMSSHLAALKAEGTDLAVFPEYCTCVAGLSRTRESARDFDGWLDALSRLAADCGTAAVFGGVPTLMADGTCRNRSYAFDSGGSLMAFYDKSHIFTVHAKRHDAMDELALFTPGNCPASFDFMGVKIGLSICYDLRYSGLFLNYRDCHLVLCTAAFSSSTGDAHWHALLKARAIEGQYWFAGADLCNARNDSDVSLYGHSAVFDPWGNEAASAPANDEALLTAVIDTERVLAVRKKLPMP